MNLEKNDRQNEENNNVPDIPRTPVTEQIFRGRWIMSPFLYEVHMDEEDRALVEQWKTEIDAEIESMTSQLAEGSLPESQKRTLGPDPTKEDIILFCIARFLMRHQTSEKCFEWKFLQKCVPGGRHHLRELGTQFDTCMDTAAAAKVLAARYGIRGEIRKPGKLFHYYFQQTDGKQAIIDSFWLRRLTGYLNRPEMYDKVKKARQTPFKDDTIILKK